MWQWRKLGVFVGGIALGVVGVILVSLVWRPVQAREIPMPPGYHAVLLDSGQIYYGKIQGVGTPYPVLTDVYYVQNKVDPETKAVSNILVRRGKEWHGPDRMVINDRHIVIIEPVAADSQVSKLIDQLKGK
jgi:hypothetical protein